MYCNRITILFKYFLLVSALDSYTRFLKNDYLIGHSAIKIVPSTNVEELDSNDTEFFRVLQQAMQTYALFIAAGFRINENALALKGCPPVRLAEAPTQADYVFLELLSGRKLRSRRRCADWLRRQSVRRACRKERD